MNSFGVQRVWATLRTALFDSLPAQTALGSLTTDCPGLIGDQRVWSQRARPSTVTPAGAAATSRTRGTILLILINRTPERAVTTRAVTFAMCMAAVRLRRRRGFYRTTTSTATAPVAAFFRRIPDMDAIARVSARTCRKSHQNTSSEASLSHDHQA